MKKVFIKIVGQEKAYSAEITSDALDNLTLDFVPFTRVKRDGTLENYFVPQNKIEYIQLDARGDHGKNGSGKDAFDEHIGDVPAQDNESALA